MSSLENDIELKGIHWSEGDNLVVPCLKFIKNKITPELIIELHELLNFKTTTMDRNTIWLPKQAFGLSNIVYYWEKCHLECNKIKKYYKYINMKLADKSNEKIINKISYPNKRNSINARITAYNLLNKDDFIKLKRYFEQVQKKVKKYFIKSLKTDVNPIHLPKE